jgi:hypothetical protein
VNVAVTHTRGAITNRESPEVQAHTTAVATTSQCRAITIATAAATATAT